MDLSGTVVWTMIDEDCTTDTTVVGFTAGADDWTTAEDSLTGGRV